MKKFQIILLGLFGGLAVFGLVMFGLFRGGSNSAEATVTMWGTVSAGTVNGLISDFKNNKQIDININYIEKEADSFDQDLVEALASGKGPDAILFPSSLLVRYSDKIYPIPTATLSISDFKKTFAQIGEIYLTDSGTLALPLSVDPLVMYWNRDIFNEARVNVPATWADLQNITPIITKKDASQNIVRGAVAMGEFSNITHARDIVVMLMMQAGSTLVSQTNSGYEAYFNQNLVGDSSGPAVSALGFYTDFANPTKIVYSWNRAMDNDKLAFISGDLAIYFGLASEYNDIINKNPNLNFDVAMVPQKKDVKTSQVIGELLGVAILNSSNNKVAAYNHLSKLTSTDEVEAWSNLTNQIPARRDLLLTSQTEPYKDLAWKSALLAKTWFNPNDSKMSVIFKNTIESIVTGRLTITDAVLRMNDQTNLLLVNK